ncbi:MAG: dihydrofolate reductase [Candidatus Aminicenantes bacterium]|nr:dihydrofolate reductase [Candidatus Aminicenantes bacterium]
MKPTTFVFILIFVIAFGTMFLSCGKEEAPMPQKQDEAKEFKFFVEQFADLAIGRFQIPGFEDLPLQQKKLLYYLYQAALSGRDIAWDQDYKYNLKIRRTLEAIVKNYKGDRDSENFKRFMVYTKRVWFSNGIHHHYSADKIIPDFPKDYFSELVKNSPGGVFPLAQGEKVEDLIANLTPLLFDPTIAPKRINLDPSLDMVTHSANNFYKNITQKEVEEFYKGIIKKDDPTPISYGMNSQLEKKDGKIEENVWKVGGMYGKAIEQIVYWLEKAAGAAENDVQKNVLDLLIKFYKTGDLKIFDEYSVAWTKDTVSRIDAVNGFIETYGDPLGFRASYESVVSFKDEEATRRVEILGGNAQWFEDHSPIQDEYKRKEVIGVSGKVITVAALGGVTSPNPPLGINLPNANWIRKVHGSKSVTLGNISHAYEKVAEKAGLVDEYAYSQEEIDLHKKYGTLEDSLHTDMHEIIGHGSGLIKPGVGTPKETLKNYSAIIEENRADLVAYYYFMDPKMVELGLFPSLDVGKVAYNYAIRNGLMQQLRRIKLGDNIEQSHMRGRQLTAKWAFELGKPENIIEKKIKNNKTYYVINDYQKLRAIFGKMLREIQRIKSEGDYEAAKNLIETYGVKVDYPLHKEVLERFEKLGVAPYTGFICPVLEPVMKDDEIVDIKVEYPMDFTEQMLFYGEKYSFLPTEN